MDDCKELPQEASFVLPSHRGCELLLPDPSSVAPQVQPSPQRRKNVRYDMSYFEEEVDEQSLLDRIKRGGMIVFRTISLIHVFVQITYKDFKARKKTYLLSFLSVWFVVALCVLLLSVLSSLPEVFLKLGESNSGAADLRLVPGGPYGAQSFDYNLVRDYVEKNLGDRYQLSAPRLYMVTTAVRSSQCKNASDGSNLWYKEPYYKFWDRFLYMCYDHGCMTSWCGSSHGTRIRLIGINLTLEEKMEWSPDSSLAVLPPKGQIILSRGAASLLKVAVGDTIFLQANAEGSLVEAINKMSRTKLQKSLQPSVRTIMTVKVYSIIERMSERFPETTNFGVVNIDHVIDLAADGLSPMYENAQISAFRSVKSTQCTSAIYFRMPKKERKAAYMQSNYEKIRASVSTWGSVVTESVGVFQLTATTPIVSFLRTMDYIISFIGLTAQLVVVAFALLSILLIYSLLTVGIETRSYELGIQRMLGLNRSDLVLTVLTNAYFFATPAWAVGLISGQLLYWLLRIILVEGFELDLNVFISGRSVGWATFAGLLIPLVASIVPIAHLIKKSLPDALNTMRNSGGVIYSIKRKGSERFDFITLFFGLLLFGFGYSIYNVLPSSLLTMNLMTIFLIFFCLLMGIIAGLVLLALNFESLIETCVIYVFLFWENVSVFSLVKKSLVSHRLENRKTTLMYALSMAFIIYITVSFSITSKSIVYADERNYGSDIFAAFYPVGTPVLHMARSSDDNTNSKPTPIDPSYFISVAYSQNPVNIEMVGKLNDHMKDYFDNGTIRKVAYLFFDTSSGYFSPRVVRQALYSVGRFQYSGNGVRPVSPTFYETLYTKFIVVSKASKEVGQYGLSGALYTKSGEDGLLMATTTYRKFALNNLNDLCAIDFTGYPQLTSLRHCWNAIHPVAVMDSSPFFLMTKFSNNMGELVGSPKTALRLSGAPYASVMAMPISHIFFDVSDERHYQQVSNKVTTFLNEQGFPIILRRVDQRMSAFKTAISLLNAFLVLALVSILIICAFALTSSMTTNIFTSSKEIGILLCLGIKHTFLYRIYYWEAFVLILSSGLLGIGVGMVVAFTMQLQHVLFTQLPVPFTFPYVSLIITIVIGVVASFFASAGPVRALLGLPSITQILRRTFA